MLLTMPVYISSYMVFSIICTVYSADIGSMKCPNKWINGKDITLICIINETSLNTCTLPASGLADFTFTPNGSTSTINQCTVQQINVDCRNVFNSAGCSCQDHSGGNYVLNYNIKVNKTIHSGGSWGCKADCRRIPTEGCSNIIIVEDDTPQPDPCPTWCIIVIVVVIILGIAIIIVVIVGTYYLKSRHHWRCMCICCIVSTPNGMHRGQNILCCFWIPNTKPTQDKDQSLEPRNGSGASP